MVEQSFRGRIEDKRFLTRTGRYVDDIKRPNQVYAALVLSTHAHARINKVDTSAAATMPGVLAVLTGKDVLSDGLGPVPSFFTPKDWGGFDTHVTLRPILVIDRVRCVGDRIGIVIAETRDQARLAAEAVIVDYDPLAVVTDARAALWPDAPKVWDDCETGNLAVKLSMGDAAATDAAAFLSAHRVIARRLESPRLAPTSVEPRCCIGEYDVGAESYTLFTSSLDPHGFRARRVKTLTPLLTRWICTR